MGNTEQTLTILHRLKGIRLSNAPVVPLGLLIYLIHERSGSGAEAA